MSGPGSSAPLAPTGRPGRLRRQPSFPAGLFDGVLPAPLAVVDAGDACFDGSRLVHTAGAASAVAFGAELAALGDAPLQRRQDFARARICAHAAVATLGRPAVPIGVGRHRDPQWPPGLVGSITHCPGYRAAAVGQASDVLAVGIDAEPDRALPDVVSRLVFTEADRSGSDRLARFRNWDLVAFSARESVFKAWFAVTGRRLELADATVFLAPDGPDSGGFTVTIGLAVPGVPELVRACGTASLTGRFRWARHWAPAQAPDLVLTAVTLRHRDQQG